MADYNGTVTKKVILSPEITRYRVSGCTDVIMIFVNKLVDGVNWGKHVANTAELWVSPEDFARVDQWVLSFPMCLACNGAEVTQFTCTSTGQSVDFYPRVTAVASAVVPPSPSAFA
jgi:hypothetical protein